MGVQILRLGRPSGIVGRLIVLLLALTVVSTACADGDSVASDDGGDTPTQSLDPTDGGDESEAPQSDGEPIVVGLSSPFSGPFGSVGPQFETGLNVGIEEIGGEIEGHPIVLKTYDDKADPATATAVARQAIDQDGVALMYGPVFSGISAATSEVYTDGKLPQFFPGGAQSIVNPEDFPYAYRVTYPTDHIAQVAVPYFVEILGIDKIGTMVINDQQGTDLEASVRSVMEEYDLKPVASEKMNTGDVDATAQLRSIKDAGAEALVMLGTGQDGVTILRAAADVGLDVPIVGLSGLLIGAFRGLAADLDLSRVYSVHPCTATDPLPADVAGFSQRVREEVYDGGEMDEWFILQAQGRDAIFILAEAVKNAGGAIDADSIRDGLNQISGFETTLGTMDFSDESNEGWLLENLTLVGAGTFNPETGAFTQAPEAVCGRP